MIPLLPVRPRSPRCGTVRLLAFVCWMLAPLASAVPAEPAASEAESAGAPVLNVAVMPQVELLSIVFRLAGNPEYTRGAIPSYTRDVDQQFGRLRNHQVVRIASQLRREHGVSFDAVMGYAVHLDSSLQPRAPFEPRPQDLDQRWRSRDAAIFHEHLTDFVEVSGFEGFFEEHRPLYKTAVKRMEDLVTDSLSLEWFDTFFGAQPGVRFTVVPALLNGPNCYGPRVRVDSDRMDIYGILGVWAVDGEGAPRFDDGMLFTIMHEFCHSYANPVVDRHEAELEKSGKALYALVRDEMRSQNYANWLTVMRESLVRAAVACSIRAQRGEEAEQREIRRQVHERHFLWMPELVGLLHEYETQRDTYPDLDSFFPRIIALFDEEAPRIVAERNALRKHTPGIVRMFPPNGAKDVAPDLEEIIVVFDRPMATGYSFCGGGPKYPEALSPPRYSEDRRKITWPVKLQADHAYEFWLNAGEFQSFQSEEGVPLESTHVTFRTWDGTK